MRIFLAVAAVLAWLFGLTMLLAPSQMYAPMGVTFTPILATVSQAHGATLVGLGLINWLARDADGTESRAVLAGNLVVQVLSLIVAIRVATIAGAGPAAPALVIHVALSSGFAWFLVRARGSQAGLSVAAGAR
jgi:hypothetical protein